MPQGITEWAPFAARLAIRLAGMAQAGQIRAGTPFWETAVDQLLLHAIDTDVKACMLPHLMCFGPLVLLLAALYVTIMDFHCCALCAEHVRITWSSFTHHTAQQTSAGAVSQKALQSSSIFHAR